MRISLNFCTRLKPKRSWKVAEFLSLVDESGNENIRQGALTYIGHTHHVQISPVQMLPQVHGESLNPSNILKHILFFRAQVNVSGYDIFGSFSKDFLDFGWTVVLPHVVGEQIASRDREKDGIATNVFADSFD